MNQLIAAPSLKNQPLTAAAMSVALALALGACGSSSRSKTTASRPPSTSTDTAAPTPSTTPTTQAQYQARLKLVTCVRAHGINVPLSVAGGSGTKKRETKKIPPAQLAVAEHACRQYITQALGNLGPQQLFTPGTAGSSTTGG